MSQEKAVVIQKPEDDSINEQLIHQELYQKLEDSNHQRQKDELIIIKQGNEQENEVAAPSVSSSENKDSFVYKSIQSVIQEEVNEDDGETPLQTPPAEDLLIGLKRQSTAEMPVDCNDLLTFNSVVQERMMKSKNGSTSPKSLARGKTNMLSEDRDLEKLKRKLQKHETQVLKQQKKRKRSLLTRTKTADQLPKPEGFSRKSTGGARKMFGSIFAASQELTKSPSRAGSRMSKSSRQNSSPLQSMGILDKVSKSKKAAFSNSAKPNSLELGKAGTLVSEDSTPESSSEEVSSSSKSVDEFEMSDLESLQDAHLDNALLENHFFKSSQEESSAKQESILRHSRNYGYVKMGKLEVYKKKIKMLEQKSKKHLMKNQKFEKEINEIRQKMQLQTVVDSGLEASKHELPGDPGGRGRTKILQTIQSRLSVKLIAQKEEHQEKERMAQEEQRQVDVSHDHEFFDIEYNEHYHNERDLWQKDKIRRAKKQLRKKQQARTSGEFLVHGETRDSTGAARKTREDLNENNIRKQSTLAPDAHAHTTAKGLVDCDHGHEVKEAPIIRRSDYVAKYTFSQQTAVFQAWRWFIIINCLYTSIVYPYYNMDGFPQFPEPYFIVLAVSEFFFGLEIILNFFKQGIDEEGQSSKDRLEVVALNYLKTDFMYDLISFLPLGYFGWLISEKLSFLWFLKAFRIRQLNEYLKDRMVVPIISKYFEHKQRKHLFSEKDREDINKDRIFIERKIYTINIVKVARLVFQMLFIAFFIGQYWYIFCHTIFEVSGTFLGDGIFALKSEADKEEWIADNPSFLHAFRGFTGIKKMAANMYFAFTTLSTIGLGDYHPKSDNERLFGSFLLLFGVAQFSFIMGELLLMIDKIRAIDKECSDQEGLDSFFLLLRMFNNGECLNQQLQEDVSSYMNFKWINDRNNFLLADQDRAIFGQLPTHCQRKIYTDFIFKEFLYKFRRFFSFRIDQLNQTEQLTEAEGSNNTKAGGTGETKIMNKHLQLLRKKVRTIMHVRASLKKDSRKKETPEEIAAHVELMRKRVDEFEKNQRAKKLQEQIKSMTKRHGYERKPQIKFPFLTFENDHFSDFMNLIMQNLEVRFYRKGEMMAYELEDCQEVLFVFSGKYNVGYEINKKRKYRKQFGHSTLIGAYQTIFQKRFLFIYCAHTDVVCYAIRRRNWNHTMSEYPEYFRLIKQKAFSFYFTQIYRPLMKQKNVDIDFFERRRDYFQVLAISDADSKEMKDVMHSIFHEQEHAYQEMRKKHQEQMKINWLSARIEEKVETYAGIAMEMAMKTECVQSYLWDRVVDGIASGSIKHPNAYIRQFYDTVWPLSWQLKNSMNRMRPLEQQKFLRFAYKLRQAALGINDSIGGIKKELMADYVNKMAKGKKSRKTTFQRLEEAKKAEQRITSRQARRILGDVVEEDDKSYISSEEALEKSIKKGRRHRKESAHISTQTLRDASNHANGRMPNENKQAQLLFGDNFMKKFESTPVSIGFGGARKHLTHRTQPQQVQWELDKQNEDQTAINIGQDAFMFAGSQGQSTLEPQFQASIVPITQRQPIEQSNQIPVAVSSQMIGFYPDMQQEDPVEQIQQNHQGAQRPYSGQQSKQFSEQDNTHEINHTLDDIPELFHSNSQRSDGEQKPNDQALSGLMSPHIVFSDEEGEARTLNQQNYH